MTVLDRWFRFWKITVVLSLLTVTALLVGMSWADDPAEFAMVVSLVAEVIFVLLLAAGIWKLMASAWKLARRIQLNYRAAIAWRAFDARSRSKRGS